MKLTVQFHTSSHAPGTSSQFPSYFEEINAINYKIQWQKRRISQLSLTLLSVIILLLSLSLVNRQYLLTYLNQSLRFNFFSTLVTFPPPCTFGKNYLDVTCISCLLPSNPTHTRHPLHPGRNLELNKYSLICMPSKVLIGCVL